MVGLDRTGEFKEAVRQKEQSYPPAQKRQRVKFGVHRTGRDHDDKDQVDPWTKQADQVVRSPAVLLQATAIANPPRITPGDQLEVVCQLPDVDPESVPRPRRHFDPAAPTETKLGLDKGARSMGGSPLAH